MHRLNYQQKLPISLEEAWGFFSNPCNLRELTPDYLSFNMTCEAGEMYPGQIITYTIKPILGIPITWVTEIRHVEKLKYFIDVQLIGPYRLWHHEHRFEAIDGGVDMFDTIHYKLPFGVMGSAVNALFIRKDIEGIFDYRKKKLNDLFGSF